MNPEESIRFVPSRVEGLPDVTEVVVRSDHLEFLSAGQWIIFRLSDIAKWPHPKWLWRLSARLGRRPKWLPVGDRDYFHPAKERFFRFYTKPTIKVYMPVEETDGYEESVFWNLQAVMGRGGFSTYDLG